MRRLWLFMTMVSVLIVAYGVQAQDDLTTNFEISYDEIRSSLSPAVEDGQYRDRWQLVSTEIGDIPVIEVNRISGIHSPQVRLFDSNGQLRAESTVSKFGDRAELIFDVGLQAEAMPYQIEVFAIDAVADVVNPIEYSLSVTRDGQRRTTPDDGDLSDVGNTPPPEMGVGEQQSISGLAIPVFGTFVDATANQLSVSSEMTLSLDRSTSVTAGITNITAREGGIGFTVRNNSLAINPQRRLFSTDSMTVAYNDASGIYTFTINPADPDNELVITTTFAQIDSIDIRDGFATFRITDPTDGRIKRFVFDHSARTIDLRRTGGDTLQYTVQINGNMVTTDLALWDTFAYVNQQVQVYVGNDSRFLSDLTTFDLTGNRNTEQQTITLRATDNESGTINTVLLSIDWHRISDILIADNLLNVVTRNNRPENEEDTATTQSGEDIRQLASVLIADGAVQYERLAGSYLTVFPDGTAITTRPTLATNSDSLPYEAGFRTLNYNNLGADILPTCPCSNQIQQHTPVNPANGNFFYPIEEFTTPGHGLTLNLTRYYNSHDSRYVNGLVSNSRLTPRYLLDVQANYPRFGHGWRHSYQYEIDISNAPLGRITFIEPDGTSHYFTPLAGDSTQWASATLRSMRIFQEGGTLGTWRSEMSDGTRYEFDRIGRLVRISKRQQSIIITPIPANPITSVAQSGVYIVDPYGRRIELYTNEDNFIIESSDNGVETITYGYSTIENGIGNANIYMRDVIYDRGNAVYDYSEVGLLDTYDDVRSPYTRSANIEYAPDNRVVTLNENPNDIDDLQRNYVYIYEDIIPDDTERITNRVFEVNGVRRVQRWTYNDLWQLVNVQLPIETDDQDWDYHFTYDASSGQLESVRVPSNVTFNLSFDERGNLIRFEDPEFTGDSAYNLTYEQRGTRSLLTEIRYPNNRTDNFVWSDGDDSLLIAHNTMTNVASRTMRTRRFEYDEFGRLVMLVEPSNIATLYTYDAVGYVASIAEGIPIDTETSFADIAPDQIPPATRLNYDLAGQLLSVTIPMTDPTNPDSSTQATYTLRWSGGRINSISASDSSTSETLTYSYDDRGRITTIDDRGLQRIYTYNGLDLITDFAVVGGAQQTFTYDEAGNVLSIVNGLGISATFEYDALDHLIFHRSENNTVTQYDVQLDNDRGWIIRSTTDTSGRLIISEYDFLGRLRGYQILGSVADDDLFQDFEFQYTSGAGQHLTGIQENESQSGYRFGIDHNAVGDILAITLEGSETIFGYTASGLLQQVTSPAGAVTRYEYDAQSNINSIIRPDATTWAYRYDSNRNLVQAVDPMGAITRYEYTALNRLQATIDALGQPEIYAYDERGNLAEILPPATDVPQRYSFTPLNQLRSITDENGDVIEFSYDLLGRINRIAQTNASPDTRLTYNNANDIIAIDEQDRRTLYSYDALGRITSMTDPAGHTTTYEYDPVGAIIRQQDALGRTETYERAAGTNFLQAYTTGANRRYTLNNDELGRVLLIALDRQTAPNLTHVPLDTQFIYDDDGHITTLQIGTASDRQSGNNDQIHQYDYSATGLPLRYTDSFNHNWQLIYDDAGHLSQVINPQGMVTAYTRDALGQITAVQSDLGGATETLEQFAYDARGNIIRYEMPDIIQHVYDYDAEGLLTQAVLAAGSDDEAIYSFSYNAFDRLTGIIEPNGIQTQYLYLSDLPNDLALRRIIGVDTRLETRYDYDDVRNVVSIITPGSAEDINISYDALDRRVRYVDSRDQSWAYTYDAADNISQISDPLGSAVSYQYDAYGRIASMTFPSGTVAAMRYYDDTRSQYINSIIIPGDVSGTTPTRYDLDEIGRVTALQTGTNILQFEYDEIGNIVRRIAANGTIATYDYDPHGRLVQTAYNNQTPSIAYTYDARGNQTGIGDIQITYDLQDRVRSVQQTNDTINYTYNSLGQLTNRSSTGIGLSTEYGYDSLSRVNNITANGQEINIIYDESGRIDEYQRGQLRTIFAYNDNGRVTQVGHFVGTNDEERPLRLDLFTYEYDAVGNLIQAGRLDQNDEATEVTYSYDIDQRLISERWLSRDGETFYVVNYQYDIFGNRIQENRNGRVTTFEYDDADRLIREQRNRAEGEFLMLPVLMIGFAGLLGILRRRRRLWIMVPVITGIFVSVAFAQTAPEINLVYEYDSNGNTTLIQQTSDDGIYEIDYEYDSENRLVTVTAGFVDRDANTTNFDINTRYTYDEISRITRIDTLNGSYQLYYDGHTLIGMEDDTSVEQYINVNGQSWMTIRTDEDGQEVLYNLNDRQGSTRRYADPAANLLDDRTRIIEFSAFGARIFPFDVDLQAPPNSRITRPTQFFAGQLYDPSTGLYLMGLRAYDPTIGRFLQPDPIRHDPVGTLYTYARNRPMTYFDPTGMTVEPLSESLNISETGTQINPQELVPQPEIPDIPAPPSVHQLQTDETFRALEVVRAVRFGLNEPVLQLSPLYDDVYLTHLNPIPADRHTMLAQPLEHMMTIYDSEHGWQYQPQPEPQLSDDPFAKLDDLMLRLAPIHSDPLALNQSQFISTTIVPDVTVPSAFSEQLQLESQLLDLLQPIQPMSGLTPDTERLLDGVPPAINPEVTLPEVNLPTAPIEPAVLHNLDALREQTYAFYSRIWTLGLPDCEDCVPPLGFNQ